MKTPFLIAAAAVLGAALTMPAAAHPGAPGHAHVVIGPAVALTPMFTKRPVWSYRIDPSVLYPIPKRIPIPVPGPGCLSCPPIDFGQQMRVLR
ncbi:MAG: hypothetical protein LJE68_17780 [Rhodobacter sp.]|jgi:hypothetical protein|nr:hypothetical protein [Rhodobacter sp.]